MRAIHKDDRGTPPRKVERPGRTSLGVATHKSRKAKKDQPAARPRRDQAAGWAKDLAAVPAANGGRDRGDEGDGQEDDSEDRQDEREAGA